MLLLFDIDGTLVTGAAEAHRDALFEALRVVHGVDAVAVLGPGGTRALRPAGRTDPEIARSILLDAGVSAQRIDARADAVREECCRVYAQVVPDDLSFTVLPGVVELLGALARRAGAGAGAGAGVILGLLTGNYEAVARLKLARAGIGRFFAAGQGAFGSDSEDRAALPSVARRRAGSVGSPYPRAETIVIGDTPRDIACARADGVRCLAVATGPFSAGELVGADAVVERTSGILGALEEMGV